MKTIERDWIEILKDKFDHPATVLWRAVELKHIDEILNRYNLPEPILDLGCAEGKIADVLFTGKKLIGLDNCWKLLRQNHKSGVYKALILADGCRMPFKNAVINSVFSNCVIEHIPELDSMLNEVSRIMKDKGIFLFTVPSHKFADFLFFSILFNNLGLNHLANWYKIKRNKLLNHFHCYDHNTWKQKLQQNNLKMLGYFYYISKKEAMLWDFLAAVVLIINKLRLHKLTQCLNILSLPYIRRMVRPGLAKSNSGAGLLIVVEKI